jgi:hypothetical protein
MVRYIQPCQKRDDTATGTDLSNIRSYFQALLLAPFLVLLVTAMHLQTSKNASCCRDAAVADALGGRPALLECLT